MATKRQKKTVITGVTREAAEEAFASYAKADAQIEKINAEIDLQCAKIREKYQQKLGELTCERECAFETLQAYATENQAQRRRVWICLTALSASARALPS